MAQEPVTVDVGYDRFRFDLILAKSKAAGLKVWPLQMDENGLAPGLIALAPHKILVKPSDLPALRAIIEELQPSETPAQGKPLSLPKRLLFKLLNSNRI